MASICWYTFGIERHNSIPLFTVVASLFACYYYVSFMETENANDRWFWMGLVGRLIICLSLPILSDDYFRFIWDGRLINAGVNPFESLPENYLNKGIPGISQELYDKLNSTAYFTIYPPLNQAVFWLAVKLFPNNLFGAVTVMRVIILGSDVANYFLLKKLARLRGMSEKAALIYFLNPLVILEFTGNLHFESVMICFILVAIWFLGVGNSKMSALALSFSVISKLLPVMYLPALLNYMSFKKAIIYYLIVGVIVIISFVPLISIEFIEGMSSSLDLYFRKFEFNASIYFMARELGILLTGYNQIAVIGPLMGLLTIVSILYFLWTVRKRNLSLETSLLFIHLFYLLFATTVHPWYVTTLIALSALTQYRFAIVWSAFIFLTYLGYSAEGFSLPSWILYMEYGVLAFFLFNEIVRKKQTAWLISTMNKG